MLFIVNSSLLGGSFQVKRDVSDIMASDKLIIIVIIWDICFVIFIPESDSSHLNSLPEEIQGSIGYSY